MPFGSLSSFATSFACGGIEDVGLGLSWDASRLADEVSRRAAVLSQMDIGCGSVVAIAHGGTARFFADLFATWSVGAAAACLDSSLTPAELRTVVEFAKSAVLLVNGAASVNQLSVPVIDLSSESPKSGSAAATRLAPDDAALVLFTSGTTGAPKGVVLTFGAVEARIAAAKGELTSLEATRDKAFADIAASKAELAVLQGGLAQAHRDFDALTLKLKRGN